MSNIVTLIAALQSGPASASDSTFPSGVCSVNFGLNPAQKQAIVQSGFEVVNLNSTGGYTALSGVGSGSPVTQATLLYARVTSPLLLRLTTFNGGGNVVSVVPLGGALILEFDPSAYLVLLEAKGAGVIEYFVSGLQ